MSASPLVRNKRLIRDDNAPRSPPCAYLMFFSERRAELAAEMGNIPSQEMTKIIAREWKNLPAVKKEVFLKKAEEGRVRYRRELTDYHNSDAYKMFHKSHLSLLGHDGQKKAEEPSESEVPIFSKQFVEHNREREATVRNLRNKISKLKEENKAIKENIKSLREKAAEAEAEVAHNQQQQVEVRRALNMYRNFVFNALGNTYPPGQEGIDMLESQMRLAIRFREANVEMPPFLKNLYDTVSNLHFPPV